MSDAISEFGELLGVGGLSGAGNGQVNTLRWGDGSRLDIESIEDDLLLSLAFPAPHPQAAELVMALKMTDLRRPNRATPLQVGLVGQGSEAMLVVAARLRARSANGHLLQREVERFQNWRRQWEGACARDGQP